MKKTLPTEILFEEILRIGSSQPVVKEDVLANYWDNKWWPKSIDDWRLRILFAGLTTRVSYNAIKKFQLVRDTLNNMGFQKMRGLDKEAFIKMVSPLGLSETRWRFWMGVQEFASKFPDKRELPEELALLSNDDLILLLKDGIFGAGYKVAQGSALYMKGYHSGIIPVDSGMKDMLGICLGLNTVKGAIGHEEMRKNLEQLSATVNFQSLLSETGYNEILEEMKPGQVNTWWVHLVLIYYKRRFCNLHNAEVCPLYRGYTNRHTMRLSCMPEGN